MLPSIAEYISKEVKDDGTTEFQLENEGVSLISLFSDIEETDIFD